MKIVTEELVGRRVRRTDLYPERGPFCPKVAWTYEGTVEKVRDVEADTRLQGAGWSAGSYRGEFHVTLRDVTMTPDPQTPLQRPQQRERVVLLGHQDGWELA